MTRVAVLNGPNLDLLGLREPEIYGRTTFAELEAMVRQEAGVLGVTLDWFQTNHEGAFLDKLRLLRGQVDGCIINAAAWTHDNLAVRDAVLAFPVPFVEVHLSNIFAREPERRHSMLADRATEFLCGFGPRGYVLGLRALVGQLRGEYRRLARQAAVLARCEAEGLAGLVVQSLPNIRWLTGFTGSAGLCVVGREGTVLVTDFRYSVQAPQESATVARIEIDQVNVWDRLFRVVDGGEGPLGFEANVATVAEAERMATKLRERPQATRGIVEGPRARKDANEVAAIRAAAVLAEEALAELLPTVRVGQSEFEIAAQLEGGLRRRGSEWHPFPTIVASGPRSALPHARTSARTVAKGEFLLIDFGAQVDGYCSDITRTFVVGAPADERQQVIYDVVDEAARRARDGVRAGQTGREADALARRYVAERGYGESFGHSLGHGLGLEVHEAPRLSPTADAILPEGAVVTIEPGVYLPGWGGVRIEDDVVLSADRAEPLTGFSRSLTTLG